MLKKYLTEKEQIDIFREIIRDAQKELALATMQEYMYQCEQAKPTHISKAKAEENLLIYQKRIRYLVDNLEVIKKYAEDHEINL